MKAPADILKFHDATIAAAGGPEPAFVHLNSSLKAGDLAVVFLEVEQARIQLADAAEGLVAPTQGTVTFLGEDWQTMTVDRAAQLRGRIGREFEGECWLSDRDLDQDNTLPQRHHTRCVRAEIEEEAMQLCHVFGLPGLPKAQSASVRWQDLQMAACVRAFLGAPVLVLLENPTSGLYADIITPLIKTVQAARQRGAAVLWTTDQLDVWNHPELHATERCKMNGKQMQVMDKTKRTP